MGSVQMLAIATVIFRYAHGTLTLSGWGWVLLAVFGVGGTTNHYYNRR